MKKPKIKIKILPKTLFFTLFVFLGLIFSLLTQLPDNNLHLYFCDVGQGDAIYIKTPKNYDVLIDGGPNDKVLDCLGKAMPFWDREIDVVVLTHPQADHLNGLLSVIKRYKVRYFVSPPIGNNSAGFEHLQELIKKKGIEVENLYTGGKIQLGQVILASIWPEKEWVINRLAYNTRPELEDKSRSLPENRAVLGLTTTQNPNDFSIVLHLKYNQFDALLTGDADSRVQDDIARGVQVDPAEILKIPHHGSKTSLGDDFITKVKPDLAIISVGKNPWGHPTEEILKMLGDQNIKILRTDQEGTIEIVTDGERWMVR